MSGQKKSTPSDHHSSGPATDPLFPNAAPPGYSEIQNNQPFTVHNNNSTNINSSNSNSNSTNNHPIPTPTTTSAPTTTSNSYAAPHSTKSIDGQSSPPYPYMEYLGSQPSSSSYATTANSGYPTTTGPPPPYMDTGVKGLDVRAVVLIPGQPLTSKPGRVICPHCHSDIVTRTKSRPGKKKEILLNIHRYNLDLLLKFIYEF